MDLAIAGKSYLVTGGSSGIGLETARLLLDEGANVTICGRDPQRLERAATDLGDRRLHTVVADVLDSEASAAAVAAAIEHGGRLDGVAAVAGRGSFGSLLELGPDAIVDELSGKVNALVNVIRPAVPALTATGGSVVGLTAPTARNPEPAMGAIGAARAAVANALEALALELAPVGVRVNAVGVGLIDTPRQRARHASSGADDDYDDWLLDEAASRGVPLGRAGTAAEVAAAIVLLLSSRCTYTTGSVIDVTGGLRSR